MGGPNGILLPLSAQQQGVLTVRFPGTQNLPRCPALAARGGNSGQSKKLRVGDLPDEELVTKMHRRGS